LYQQLQEEPASAERRSLREEIPPHY
jgi:uncharacterized coiled-coil protein SlyX